MHALSDLPGISHMLMIAYDKSYLYMMMNRLNPSETDQLQHTEQPDCTALLN